VRDRGRGHFVPVLLVFRICSCGTGFWVDGVRFQRPISLDALRLPLVPKVSSNVA